MLLVDTVLKVQVFTLHTVLPPTYLFSPLSADFTSDSWIKKLSDPTENGNQVRKQVFFRLRSPNPEIAKGQADPRWMPRLSGNGGRCTSGDPTTWSSLTPYQYKVPSLPPRKTNP